VNGQRPRHAGVGTRRGVKPVNGTAQGTLALPARPAMLLAVEVLLADPGALGNDALEGDLYILRDKLGESGTPAG
jgi:hypothetical protein